MTKKHVFIIIGVILCICIVATVIYLKVKHDEKEKQKSIYYKEQQERITLYLKHNTKEPNTIKSVHFTSLKRGPMGDAVIEGYINENKEADFVAYGSPEENYQFTGGLTGSNEVLGKLKNAENLKSPEKIKEEINKKKNTKQ
ncbi:membrane protein [Staphylococcus aureus]|nr:membrane protein [Staphylococcus aureus]